MLHWTKFSSDEETMRKIALSVICAAAFACAAPASAQRVPEDQYGTEHARPSDDDIVRPVSRDAGAIAEGLRLEGKCDLAVPKLRPIAERGAGHEIAEHDLALCLFDLAKADADPKHAAELRKEAADWVVRAANGGFAKSQSLAVALYLDGNGVSADPVEAEKWAILYHHNGMRIAIGLPALVPDVQKRLDALSDAQESEAKKRANDWAPVTAAQEE
jgi:TPR repeat protein